MSYYYNFGKFMKYRTLGKTDLKISEISFGCQSIGGGLFYKDNPESIRTLHSAYDSGVNFFDTSDHYTLGESEKLIGKAFKGNREKIIIGTKAGTLYSQKALTALKLRAVARPFARYLSSLKIPFHLLRAKEKRKDFSPKYLVNSVEKSLARLQTDYIDIFQLHKPSKEILRRGEFIETLEKLKQEGKIRYFGISTAENEDAFICMKHPEISTIQITFNLLDNDFAEEILEEALKKNVGIIARNPRAQGHLTKSYSDIMAETYAQNKNEFSIKQLKAQQFAFLIKNNRTLAQAALQYVLSFNGISSALPRAVNRRQLREIIGTQIASPLSEGEHAKIEFIKKGSGKWNLENSEIQA